MNLRVFIGWDERDALAANVCASSLRRLGCEPTFLRRDTLVQAGVHKRELFTTEAGQHYDVQTKKPQSTEFAFTRFHLPQLCDYQGWALFTDPDTLWTESPEALLHEMQEQGEMAVWCVQHEHSPNESETMRGLIQTRYPRKNWSSVMLCDCGHTDCRRLGEHDLTNTEDGLYLHGFGWTEQPGQLADKWNWLALPNRPAPIDMPACIHWTLGGPWMRGYAHTPYADLWRAEVSDFWWKGRTA